MTAVAALAAGLVIGFAATLLTLRLRQRWCSTCGANLTCCDCTHRAQQGVIGHGLARPRQ